MTETRIKGVDNLVFHHDEDNAYSTNCSIRITETTLHKEDKTAHGREINSNISVTKRHRRAPDAGLRKWFVLGAGFSNFAITVGFLFNLPIMYVEWKQEFRKSNSETALVQSICAGSFHISGLVSGMAIAKYGCRKCGIIGGILSTIGLVSSFFANSILFLCLSVGVSGIGFSICYVSATTVVEMHFNGRLKMMAIAFMVFGSGVGMAVYPIFLKTLLTEYGWRGTLLIVAAVMLNLVVNATIFKHPITKADIKIIVGENTNELNSEQRQPNSNTGQCVQEESKSVETRSLHIQCPDDKMSQIKKRRCLRDILKALLMDKIFDIFLFSLATGATVMNSISIFFIDYYHSKGISDADSIRIFMYMNISVTVSQLFPGLLKQLPHISSVFLPFLSILLGCVATAAFPFIGPSYGLNLIAACIFGVGFGSLVTSSTIATVKLIPQDSYSVGLGMCLATIGVFLVISGPIAGYIRDKTGNYDVSFLSASVVLFISCISFLITMVYRHYSQNRTQIVVQTKL